VPRRLVLGMAFLVDAARVRPALARLWNRGDAAPVYEPRLVLARLRGGRLGARSGVPGRPEHPSYVRELDLHGRARLVAQGIGFAAPVDYIQNTLAHMHHVGVRDPTWSGYSTRPRLTQNQRA